MLILASASPRRRDLLTQAGFEFLVDPAHIDETRLPGELPAAYVRRLALTKALATQTRHPASTGSTPTVLGADTTVVLGTEILNKPGNAVEAARMLRALSARSHEVLTGLAVLRGTQQCTHVERTVVTFAAIAEPDLAAYIASGDPLDKAGAYGIQGFAARWIPRIEGDFFNVVGLPLAATVRLLAEAGYREHSRRQR